MAKGGGEDPKKTPWHPKNCPRGEPDRDAWSKACREWCAQFPGGDRMGDFTLRTHLKCPRCKFRFIYRTSYWAMRTSSDVQNFGKCANPSCKHSWDEWA